MRANAISGSWSGTEEENFARIDAQFGEGTNLDILWRCIYRNSLSLNDASSSLGELDFTEGSGWEYEINGTYPSYGMDKADLKPGDTLTLRYTLAYGWDIGNGSGPWKLCRLLRDLLRRRAAGPKNRTTICKLLQRTV